MATQCPACSKVNPADAVYCYYDGRALGQGSQDGPLKLGTMPFPMPFSFSNGQGCSNFNQLALACDERWEEARSLLAEGIWPTFFAAIGRLDLMAAAKQAAKEPDQDVGLSQLLERFPADANVLRPPKLALPAAQEDLGTLEPGKDHKFEVRITNQGMLVLHGTVMTDCDWLAFGDRNSSSTSKMFQTRNIFTLPVRVLGHKIRAGRKPIEGKIVIDTNGGSIALTVRANVPVREFPKGQYANDVLAGAKSPHELAVKAKANPQEAAVLFEQGAVKAWYASNGWTYPIQGTEGTGKGAVQQFFEALGLTKPPKLEISTGRILCKGRPGKKLNKQVIISTKESRAVYAEAWSNQPWIKPVAGKPQGNTLTIPLQIEVPHQPGETLHADVTLVGNGKQRFVVPVSLAVVAVQTEDESEPEEASRGAPWGLILAAAAIVLVAGAGAIGYVLRNKTGDPENPPVVQNPNVEPPAPLSGAWWDTIPDAKMGVALVALKQHSPQEQEMFDGLAEKSDIDRFRAYEQLADKLPELVRNPKAREPLGQLLTDCFVHEPSERNLAPLRRALATQLPRDGAEFRPEEKGDELERAFWALQVNFAAMHHKAIRPDRSKSLGRDLEGVFGFALDVSSPPEELKTQTEKLLAVRCYRATLPTAARSIDHALVMRGILLERMPKLLPATFRDQVDTDLVAISLSSKGAAMWPTVEPILKASLESNDLTIGLKIVGIYERAPAEVAKSMEGLLAAKWKAAANPTQTQAERAAAVRSTLVGAVARAKITPAERLAQLQKLTSGSLAAVKAPQKKESAALQETLRLAHASTMACSLFHKELGLERFDELVSRVPEIEQTEAAKGSEPMKTGDAPNESAPKGTIVVGAQPRVLQGQLTPASERDPGRGGHYCKIYPVSMKAGQLYSIDMVSNALDSYLRLESPSGQPLAADDDGGGYPHARIVFPAQADGVYRVIATTYRGGATGNYTVQITQGAFGGNIFGGRPFGTPSRVMGKKGAGGAMPGGEQPGQKGDTKQDSSVNQADISNLDSKQSNVRISAFNNLAGSVGDDLAPRHAQKIGRYLMQIQQKSELDDVESKLDKFGKCRQTLLALADAAGNESLNVAQKTAETVVGGVLGQALQFARDEDWRSACRRLLLQRALELSGRTNNSAEEAAEILSDLYREQGVILGIDDPTFAELTRPAQVLERVVKHVAAKASKLNPMEDDKAYVDQIDRHLQAARFIADNDLEHMILLQRMWIRVLAIYLQGQAPAQAKGMLEVQQDLINLDRRPAGMLDQLRNGEEKVLRIWALAHKLK